SHADDRSPGYRRARIRLGDVGRPGRQPGLCAEVTTGTGRGERGRLLSGFTFHQTWLLPVSPASLTTTLAEVGRYPCWWPQVRSVRRINDGAAQVAVRSLLPFTLQVVIS